MDIQRAQHCCVLFEYLLNHSLVSVNQSDPYLYNLISISMWAVSDISHSPPRLFGVVDLLSGSWICGDAPSLTVPALLVRESRGSRRTGSSELSNTWINREMIQHEPWMPCKMMQHDATFKCFCWYKLRAPWDPRGP